MKLLKDNQELQNIEVLEIIFVHEDNPVICLLKTTKSPEEIISIIDQCKLDFGGLVIDLTFADLEIVRQVEGLDKTKRIYYYRVVFKKTDTDFTPKYVYKIGSGQEHTVQFTVVNLLGSYGNYSTDSDSDSIADGWIRTGTVGTYSLAEGKQRYTVPSGELDTMQGIQIQLTIPAEEQYLYFRTNYESYSSHQNEDGIRILNVDIWGGSNPQWGVYPLRVPSQAQINNGLYSFCIKKLSGNIGMNVYPFLVRRNNYTQESYVVVSKTMVVDLTVMGELPEALKDFFFNNVNSWQDLGIRAYTLLPSKQKDSSGNYIVRTGLEWLNYLIDYVDSTGVVTKTLKF